MKKAEREAMLRQRLVEMQEIERTLRAGGARYIAGVDEVGRGPLAGPVVTACVVLPEDFDLLGVDDSKKISEKKRNELYQGIKERAIAYGIGIVDNKEIDRVNILQATKKAMYIAIEECDRILAERLAEKPGEETSSNPAGSELGKSQSEGLFGSDEMGHVTSVCTGNIEKSAQKSCIDHILIDAVKLEDLEIPSTSIIKGDSKSLSIAAASILAKVTRDSMMIAWDQEYPGYGFASNKGYGTKAHYDGIAAQGVCPLHRMTFLKGVE